MNQILKVALKLRKDGTYNVTASGRTEKGKVFAITSAPVEAGQIDKKMASLAEDFDLESYPYDSPEAVKALGEW